jgi:hypothetical protein
MTFRRTTIAAAVLMAAAAAAGVALGAVHARHAALGGYKCKAQACAHVYNDGTFIGNHPGFSSVSKTGTGGYCLELTRIPAGQNPTIQITVDYVNSPGTQFNASVDGQCGINGIKVVNETDTPAFQDFGFYVTIS